MLNRMMQVRIEEEAKRVFSDLLTSLNGNNGVVLSWCDTRLLVINSGLITCTTKDEVREKVDEVHVALCNLLRKCNQDILADEIRKDDVTMALKDFLLQ